MDINNQVISQGIKNFSYSSVILNHSIWEKQREETINLYLNISNDDLLYIFRKKAGIPTTAQGLTGWYGNNACTFGQKLGAFAKLYCATGDERLKGKSIALAESWAECVNRNSAILQNDAYVYEKLLGGFLDMYEYLDYMKAEKYISKLTDWAISNFKRDIKRDGMQDAELVGSNMIEWYTLPENLYRAYELLGDDKYRYFAKEWDYDYLWDKLNSKDFNIGPRHAYSHVNALSSAAKTYEVTGDERYLSAIKIAYEEILNNHTYATGGYGPAECLFADNPGYLGDALKSTWDESFDGDPVYTNFGGQNVARSDAWGSCEVSCCAWAVFKICDYLIRLTGDARYGNWAEKMLVNGTAGQLPITPEGKVMYYANYFLDGAVKSVEDRRLQPEGQNFTWQCCTGTFPQIAAEYSNMLYYHDQRGIFINQYMPSVLNFEHKGVPVSLKCNTEFPDDGKMQFYIKSKSPIFFVLRLRIPSWASGKNTIKVNGISRKVEMEPNRWAVVERVWKDGDVVEVEFPYSLYFSPVDQKNPEIVALNYGPLVLVSTEMTILQGDINYPEKWIHPVLEEKLSFQTTPGHTGPYDFVTRKFVPYYKIEKMEWYYMYNRIFDNI